MSAGAAATSIEDLLDPVAPDLRLVPAALASWGSCAAAVGLAPSLSWVLAGSCAVLAAALGWAGRGRRSVEVPGAMAARGQAVVGVVLVVGVVGVCLAATGWRVAARTSGVAGQLIEREATVEVSGLVRTDPHRVRPRPGRPVDGADRWVVRLAVEQLSGRGVQGEVRLPVVVLGGQGWDHVAPGERIETVGRLAATAPGDDAAALLVVRGPPRVLEPAGTVMAGATRLREGLRDACAGLPPDARGLLPSLVVGDTSGLPPDLEEDMRTTGLTHLSAVSGANFTLVCGTVLVLLTAIGVGRLPRLAVAAVAAIGFVVLARPEPSVLRAAAMGLVGLLGLAGSRRAAGVPALSMAVVLLCVVDPWLSRSAGFALSVLATGGLLLLAGPWTRALAHRLPTWAAAALAVPLAAQAVCSPVLVLLAPQLSLVAVPANVLVAPAVAPATVLGVVAALLAPLWPQGAAGVAWLGGWSVRWIALVARQGADLPHAAVGWPAGAGGAALLAGLTVLAIVVVALLLGRLPSRPSPSGTAPAPALGRVRPTTWATAGALLCALGVQLGLADPVLARWGPGRTPWPGPWQVAACDVGQGQALVVRTAGRGAVVVDAGPDADLVDGCLRRLQVDRVDLLVLTHFHADHVAGLPGVLRGREVAQVLVSPVRAPTAGAGAVDDALAGAGLTPSAPAPGTVITLGTPSWPVVVEVLAPGPPFDRGERAEDLDAAANDASVVLHVRTGSTTVLATGDVEPPAQQALEELLRARPDLVPVDVVSVAHHGSAQQHAPLYELLRARVALVSAGRDNDYGHPAPATLELLEATGSVVARTDECGDLALAGDSGQLWVDGEALDPRPP